MSEVTFTGRCPQCGYSDKSQVKQVSNVMNYYKNEKGEIATIPSAEKEIITGNCTWKLQPKDKSQEIGLTKVENPIQASAIAAASIPPAPLSEAGDFSTGLAKGAMIKTGAN